MMMRTSICFSLSLLLTLCIGEASASPLTGAGLHLPIPTPNIGDNTRAAPGTLFPQIVQDPSVPSLTGSWSSPAKPDWVGTWSATGLPTNNISSGITVFDFTAMPLGALPVGTFVRFGDVDSGAGVPEYFELQAYADAQGTQPLMAWLDGPVGVRTSGGTGPGQSVQASDMPRWEYNTTSHHYTIDGSSVPGNPNVAFVLQTNQPIVRLDVAKATSPYQLDLLAPTVPEPSTGALAAALVAVGLARFQRRR